MLKIPHCLDSRLTDGGKVVSPAHRPRSPPQKYYFSASGTHSCYRLSKAQGVERLEGLDKLKKIIHLIGVRIRDLVPKPQCHCVSPKALLVQLQTSSYTQRIIYIYIYIYTHIFNFRCYV
jgi:hypothetical protein